MPGRAPGHSRSVLFVVLMSAFTFGIYWFYWTRMAYQEIAAEEEQDVPHRLWLLCVFAYVLMVAVSIPAGYFSNDYPTRLPSDSLAEQTTPILLLDAAATALFFGLQLAYLWRGSIVLQKALKTVDEPSPYLFFVASFSILLGIQGMPKVGSIAAILGTVVAVLWLAQTQLSMNVYWKEIEARHWMPTSSPTPLNAQPQPPT